MYMYMYIHVCATTLYSYVFSCMTHHLWLSQGVICMYVFMHFYSPGYSHMYNHVCYSTGVSAAQVASRYDLCPPTVSVRLPKGREVQGVCVH